MSCIHCMITVYDRTVPVVFISNQKENTDNELVIDDTSSNLSHDIEKLAKTLKRADYHQVVLVKSEIDDTKPILNVARLFDEEDIEVIGVYHNNLLPEISESLNEAFEYGVIDMMMLLNQNAKMKVLKK